LTDGFIRYNTRTLRLLIINTQINFFSKDFLESKKILAQSSELLDNLYLTINQPICCEAIIEHKINASIQREAYTLQKKIKEF